MDGGQLRLYFLLHLRTPVLIAAEVEENSKMQNNFNFFPSTKSRNALANPIV